MERLSVRWRALVAAVLVAAAVVSAVLAPRLRVDNSLERWAGSDPGQAASYQRFRQLFGSDEQVLVAVSGRPLLDEESLDLLTSCLEQLEAVPGVRRVQGLPQLFRDLFGSEDVEALEREMTATPFYRDLFISKDGQMAGLLLEVEPGADAGSRRRLIAGVREAVAPFEKQGFRVDLVGSTALIVAIDELSAGDARRSLPIALAGSLAVLALLLRSLKGLAIAAACSAVPVLLTAGLVVLSGRTLNMISSVLPTLIFVLALAVVLHIVRRFQQHRGSNDCAAALERAVAETTRPCVAAAVTTAFGFLSLVTATMAPVRELGVFAAAAILLALVVNLTLAPVLLRLLDPPAAPALLARRATWLELGLRRPRTVVVVFGLLLVVSLVSLPWVRVASNPLSFLPASHPTVRAYAEVGKRLTGFYTMEVMVNLPVDWTEQEVWQQLEPLERRLDSSPIVAKLVSPLDVLRQLSFWGHDFDPNQYRLPASAAEAQEAVAQLPDSGRKALAALVSADRRTVRLSAVVNEMDEARYLELVASTRQVLSSLPAGYSGVVTGQVLQLVTAQQQLVKSQLSSLSVAVVIIFAGVGLGMRSWRLLALAVPPSLLPTLSIFAVMAAFRIPLDPATVMVASIALGIADDNTVHLLSTHGEELAAGADGPQAMSTALRRVAPAMVVTTATAGAGFFSLLGSAFVPVRHFGLLSGLALLVALAAALLLVPAMVTMARRFRS